MVEKYGLVFAFLGDLPEEERPPMMEIPEFDSPDWRPTWVDFDAPFNYERSVENGIDPAHNEFVHPTHGFSGENAEYKVNDLRWLEKDNTWGYGFFHRNGLNSKRPATHAKRAAARSGLLTYGPIFATAKAMRCISIFMNDR